MGSVFGKICLLALIVSIVACPVKGDSEFGRLFPWTLWRTGNSCSIACPPIEKNTEAPILIDALTDAQGSVTFTVIPFADFSDNVDGGNGYGYFEVFIGGTRMSSGVSGHVSGAPADGKFRRTTGLRPSFCCTNTQNQVVITVTDSFFNSKLGVGVGVPSNSIRVTINIPSGSNVPCAAVANGCANMDDGYQEAKVEWTPACSSPPDECCDISDCPPIDCQILLSCNAQNQCDYDDDALGTACGSQASTECSDPDTCNSFGSCLSNNLNGGPCGDSSDTICDNPDTCNSSGICQNNNEPDLTSCSDSLFCNGDETCQSGSCTGDPNLCDDGIGCTDDTCNENTDQCNNFANDTHCTNNVFCDGTEFCDAVLDCQSTGDPCLGLFCDETTDTCGCTLDSHCDDGIGCTDDSCVGGECFFTPDDLNCVDNGLFCDGNEICNATLDCQSTGDPCAVGTFCNDTTDVCDECVVDTDCDDGVGCTDDFCLAGDCSAARNDANCSQDGIFCNGIEYCHIIIGCITGNSPCHDFIECTEDSCDEDNDVCTNIVIPGFCENLSSPCKLNRTCRPDQPFQFLDGCDDGTNPCDDGLYCNISECNIFDGSCSATVTRDCSDNLDCTDDSCNENTDQCDNITNDANCDNGLWCDGNETCSPTLDCTNGLAPDCDDGVACTDDCNEDSDQCDNVPNNANCDNGLWCDGDEICDPTLDCVNGTAPDCDDGATCTNDSCNENTDQCDNIVNVFDCDNFDWCDGTETCDPVLGDPITGCKDESAPCNDCQDCDDLNQLCINNDSNICDDGDSNSVSDFCLAGVCRGIFPPTTPAGELGYTKDFYISFDPTINSEFDVAYRVLKGTTFIGWITTPISFGNGNGDAVEGMFARLTTTVPVYIRDYQVPIHVKDCKIFPSDLDDPDSDYHIEATIDDNTYTESLTVYTTPAQEGLGRYYGDIVGGLV